MLPTTSSGIAILGKRLVDELRSSFHNTECRRRWTERNKQALKLAVESLVQEQSLSVNCFPDHEKANPEFLWDFIAYVQGYGILLAAESEWDMQNGRLREDFEKLLYVRSPLKLMICRMRCQKDAERTQEQLRAYLQETCNQFSPGELFVLYCVYWSETDTGNRDHAYLLQIPGEPHYVSAEGTRFEPFGNPEVA